MAEKTANEELFDALVRHQTYLLRYSSYIRNRMATILNASEDDLARRIRDKLRNSKGLTTPNEWKRLMALINDITAVRGTAWTEANDYMIQQATDLSYNEPISFKNILETTAPVIIETVMPTVRLLRSIALSRPFEGRILKEWASTMQAEDIRRISNAIQVGMVAGEDSAAIARRVVGSSTLKGTDGMTEITRRQINAITRTAVNHIANNARSEFLAENVEVITAEQFVATLDSRTTPICRSLDGKVFEPGKGPRPPLHYACRSLRVAAFDGERLGNRPMKASTQKQLLREYSEQNNLGSIRSRDDLPHGSKGDFDKFARKRVRELTGRVPAATTYQEWLSKQSAQFQDDTLGVTKGKLFREGGLKLDRFVDVNGNELTLADIAKRDASAFVAAGLDPKAY